MGPRCRLCLAEIVEDRAANIFTYTLKHSEDSFVHVLSQVFTVEINAADQCGKDVCDKCVDIIEYVLLVRKRFQMCQEDLQKSIINEKNKESPKNKLEEVFQYPQVCRPTCVKPSDVRVSLENLHSVCQASVNLIRWENSLDFMSYRKLSDRTYKPRKHRHFKLDDKLINDICSSLDEIRDVGFYNMSRDIGTNTDDPLNSCDCKNDKYIDTDDIRNIVNVRKNILPAYLKRADNANNTLNWKGTSVGVNQKYENTIRVAMQDLCNFAQPKVILEPAECLIRRENYEEVGKNCYYIKRYRLENESNNHFNTNSTKKRRLSIMDPTNNVFTERVNKKTAYDSEIGSASPHEKRHGSASIGLNENSTKSTSAKTKTSTTKNIHENGIDSSTKVSSLHSTYKDQQSNSNTEKNIAATHRVKLQRLKNNRVTPTSENSVPQPTFIWERNCLGKYSAINFYKQSPANTSGTSASQSSENTSDTSASQSSENISDNSASQSPENTSDTSVSQSKKDLCLSDTILKLAGRLEHPLDDLDRVLPT
ncbi:unnamed protein product [Ceutorhynchus assimilis]|uniref:ZAD domain-containing protein n=1 Tax=Ceutorhynchus assimilis TaxID=467358 RepID=A0A9N9MMI0_9CUCU|nr:unnamed protein product [Ceutorhynchus assimilis]